MPSPLPLKNLSLSHKELERMYWKKILKSEKLFDSLITSSERHNIVMRAAVAELVDSGMGTRQISRELSISRQTISNIKRITKESAYKSYRERGKTERRKKAYNGNSSQKKKEHDQHYRQTKYGKVYLP
ncbi:MAG: Trp family transcriptional regulator [Candidatus Jorgensenbacteria bacterium]|nr:Trp family transcriptional regulator [Candidatus Jorgensenbacteria bacterium]